MGYGWHQAGLDSQATRISAEKNMIPYISSDTITIGENGGVSGGICNVVYYPDVLGKIKMDMIYDTLKLKNPPIL